MIAGCELPIIACRRWCEGMEAGVEKRGGTGRKKRMTGAGEDGERGARCSGRLIGLIGRFGLIGGFRHPGSLTLQTSSDT